MMSGCILLANISDRIVDRELSDPGEGKRERIVGRRLKEGYVHYKRYLEILNALSKHGFGYAFERLKSYRFEYAAQSQFDPNGDATDADDKSDDLFMAQLTNFRIRGV